MNSTQKRSVQLTYRSFLYIIRWTALAVLVGGTVGLAAVAFIGALNWGIDALEPFRRGYLLYLLPAVGLGLSGIITSTLAPEAAGSGVDAVIRAYNRRWGKMSIITAPVKLVASVCTIAFGGSAGRVGPTVQMGGALAYWVGRLLGLNLRDSRKVVICGIGAAFGAIFTAPLAGGVFGGEILYRDDVEYNNLFISFISSITAFFVYSVLLGKDRLFAFTPPPNYTFLPYRDILYFVMIGVAIGVMSLIFVKCLSGVERLSDHSSLPVWIRTSLGGVMTGITAIIATPLILGTGVEVLEILTVERMSIAFLALLLVGKIAATSFAIGSGASGGLVGPALVMGGIAGALLASLTGYPAPVVVIAAASVGFLGSAGHIPIATTILAAELFGMEVLKAATIVCFIGSWIARDDTMLRESLVSRAVLHKAPYHFDDEPF